MSYTHRHNSSQTSQVTSCAMCNAKCEYKGNNKYVERPASYGVANYAQTLDD